MLTKDERADVARDLLELFEDLGRIVSTPAINELAERRRVRQRDLILGEIRRVQMILGREGTAG